MKRVEERSDDTRLVKGTLNHTGERITPSDESQSQSIPTLNSIFSLIDDNRTTGNAWYINVKAFPQNEVEIVALKLGTDDRFRRGGGAKRTNENKNEMSFLTLKKSQLRAKKKIRHKLLMMQADRMLTLTYRENMKDISQAWKDLKAFNRLMKSRYKDWSYVAVPEYQKRGAVHFHLAISGYYHANTVRRIWNKVIGSGNIDITSPRVIDKASWNPKRIANYLSKYITKEDSVVFNKRRYSSSAIDEPPSLSGWVALGLPMYYFMSKLLKKLTNKNESSYWEADGYFPICMMTT